MMRCSDFRVRVRAVLVAVAGCLLLPAPARAATITITDLTDDVVIEWSGFLSININGHTYDPLTGTALDPTAGSLHMTESIDPLTGFPRLFSFAGEWASPLVSNWVNNGNFVIHFLDADGTLSDILQMGYEARGTETEFLSGVFSSAIDGAPLWSNEYLTRNGLLPNVSIAEGTGVEVAGYFPRTGSGALPSSFTSFLVSSGGDSIAVPEPGTLSLLGLGLAGLGLTRRRKGA